MRPFFNDYKIPYCATNFCYLECDDFPSHNKLKPPVFKRQVSQKVKMGLASNMPYFLFLLLFVMSSNMFQADHVGTKGIYWRLDSLENKVINIDKLTNDDSNATKSLRQDEPKQDTVFEALLSTSIKNGIWTKHEAVRYCTSDVNSHECNGTTYDIIRHAASQGAVPDDETAETAPEPDDEQEPPLDCGKSVNFTHYDHLVGVSNRQRHPALVPEPHAGLVFRRRGDRASDTIDLDVLEKKLRRSKREKPKSLQLYNQIGNFWRVKGDASKAIECFRRSLAVSPNNAEVLLNLARVLFNLQYLDDAIFLTRRSLEVQPPDQNAWLQHFTLGEILKEYGNYQEAEMHLRHTLELRPRFQPAQDALRQMEAAPATQLHGNTVFIIIVLVSCVLFSILSTLESAETDDCSSEGGRLSGRSGSRATRGRCRRSV
ncbi:uncharacterized protein LOC122375757 isoform X1 [Amphibalanus amphitrite]|uniref:uncharacterized protein LOC122375757 isoform X1 n=2 Tax=Amphibalanus amphitrite TaxID=1232801 RepID=UPI001C917DBF|nr:uncharacterized protein LOC122375757 isoform X1 [Amphibalanus amphitrite]XP_043211188.1 uncharacterized protein LOC122375757 isoform X1 [Amphibalanus amphitrite]